MRLKKKFPELRGAMMAVGGSKEEIAPLIAELTAKEVRIACFNSPTSLTISGDEAAIDELQSSMEARQIFNRKLQVDVAYHSHHMKLVSEEYLDAIQLLELPKSTPVKFYSSLYGKEVDGCKLGPSYWVDNLTQSVRFSEALTSMCDPLDTHKTGVNMLVEIGPHSALAGPVKQILKACGATAAKIPYASALVRKRDAVETALELASALFVRGAVLHLGAINLPKPGPQPTLLVDMPRYPWNHKTKYWHESRMIKKHKDRTIARNDLLGTLASYSNDLEPTWRNILRIDDLPWLRHHKIQSLTLFPMSGFLAMAVEAAAQRATTRNIQFDSFEFRDVSVDKPLIIVDEDIEMTLQLRPHQGTTLDTSIFWDEFHIHSWTASRGWTEHCKGLVSTKATAQDSQAGGTDRLMQPAITQILRADKASVDKASLYDSLSALGVSYGSTFQGMEVCEANDCCSMANIVAVDTSQEMPQAFQTPMIVHPAFLEQLIEMYWPILGAGRIVVDTVYLPSSIRRLSISRRITEHTQTPGDSLRAFCQGSRPQSYPKSIQMSMFATTSNNSPEPLIKLDDLTISPILEREASLESDIYRELCYKMDWEPVLQHVDLSIPNGTSNGTIKNAPNGISSHVNGTSNGIGLSNGTPKLALDNVVIVHGNSEAQNLLAAKLSDSFSTLTGTRPELGSLGDVDPRGKVCLFLMELDKALLLSLDSSQFFALQKVLTSVQGVLWVSSGAYIASSNPDANMVTGLSRSIRSETLLKFATFDLEFQSELNVEDIVESIVEVFKATFGPNVQTNCELEFVERGGKLFTPRIIDDAEMNEYVHKQTKGSGVEPTLFAQDDRPLKLAIETPGSLGTLHFVDHSLEDPLQDDEVEVKVAAVGMNMRDIHTALGHLDSFEFGSEFSGTITSIGCNVVNFTVGDRVAGLSVSNTVYSTFTRTKSSFVFHLLDSLSFDEGATLPVAYGAAQYGLITIGQLIEGEPVLIHNAVSAVGQAAIHLAQSAGAEVFVTVASIESRNLLREICGLEEDHIILIENSAYGMTLQASRSRFEVVLNCGHADAETSRDLWESLTNYGRFIDVERQKSGARLETNHVDNNKSFMSVDLMAMARDRPRIVSKLVSEISTLVEHGKIKALVSTVFPISDVETAFKVLQSGNLEGKLVVSPRRGNMVKVCHLGHKTCRQTN